MQTAIHLQSAVQGLVEELVRSLPGSVVRTGHYRKWLATDLPANEFGMASFPGWEDACSTLGPQNFLLCLQTAMLGVLEALVYHAAQGLSPLDSLPDLGELEPREVNEAFTHFESRIKLDPSINRIFTWFREPALISREGSLWQRYREIIELVIKLPATDNVLDDFTDLYSTYFTLTLRKSLGEEFTNPTIARFILDQVDYQADRHLSRQLLIDPAAGFGVFLAEALDRLFLSVPESRPEQFASRSPVMGCEYKAFTAFACHLLTTARFLAHWRRLFGSKINFKMPPSLVRQGNALSPQVLNHERADFVVGNPPYVRIQNIPPALRAEYGQLYTTARGRFDLAFLFVERAVQLLNEGGTLGYVLTNKFMTTAAGQGLRNLLREQASIRLLVDLGDSAPFGAAVLPCIIIAKKKAAQTKEPQEFPYALVTKNRGGRPEEGAGSLFESIAPMLKEPVSPAAVDLLASEFPEPVRCRVFRARLPVEHGTWHFADTENQAILDALVAGQNTTLGDLAERITVGIKSTADDVFVRPLSERFIHETSLERSLLHPYVQGANVKRWQVDWQASRDKYVLYPYEKQHDKIRPVDLLRYPRTKQYLEGHRARLEGRSYVKEAGRLWYELWVRQNPSYFEKAFKILTPDFAARNTFALDEDQHYVGGSALAIILKDQEEVFAYYILGLLNSALYEFFHKKGTSTFIYAGRYRYWTSYLSRYPVFDYRQPTQPLLFQSGEGRERTGLCLEISELARRLSRGGYNAAIEDRLNNLAYDLFDIDDSGRRLVGETLRKPSLRARAAESAAGP